MNNLPEVKIEDSAANTRLFFDVYGKDPLEFLSVDIDYAVGFFTSRGFDRDAAEITALTVLKQAKLEHRHVFEILDNIDNDIDVSLNTTIATVLNNNRIPTSIIGFKSDFPIPINVKRNILP